MTNKSLLISRKFGSSFEVAFGGVKAKITILEKYGYQVSVRIEAPEAVKVTRDNAKARVKHG